MTSRLSDPVSTKIIAEAHVEALRGRRRPRRPRSVRAN
jgi:hypothetical protein